MPGTRELVIAKTPYLAPYQVIGDTLQILRVYHGSRQFQIQMSEDLQDSLAFLKKWAV